MEDFAPAPEAEATPAAAPAGPSAFHAKSDEGRIYVTKDGGDVQSLPEEQFAAAQAEGYRPATRAEYFATKDGLVGDIGATALGGARGITFGLSDPLYVEGARYFGGDQTADEVRQIIRETKEGHEGLNLAGEVGGSLAGMFLLPGGSAKAVGEEGLFARAVERIAGAAPRLMGEGAAMGVGQQLSEDTLGNHELVAQNYLASGIKGGIFAALVGSGLSAGGGAIGDVIRKAAPRAAEVAEGGAYRALGTRAEETAAKPIMRRVTEAAEEQAAKSILPASTLSGSELQRLGATAEEQATRFRRVGRTLLDEGIVSPTATKKSMAPVITAAAKEAGAEVGAVRRELEHATARPSAEDVLQRISTEVITPLMERPLTGATQRAIFGTVEEIAKKSGAKLVRTVAEDGSETWNFVKTRPTYDSFDELFKLRKGLDDILYPPMRKGFTPPPPPKGAAELDKIRGILESEFEKGAERAAGELGDDVAARYRVAKAKFADLETARKWVTKAVARESQHRAISLSDTVMAGAGIMSGSPLGMLAPVANKLLRTYGNQVAASALERASKIEALQRAALKGDELIAGSVKKFFAGGGERAAAKATTQATPEQTRAIRELVANPEQLTARISDSLERTGMHDHAPGVVNAMATTLVRAANYVGAKLPPEPKPSGLTFGAPPARRPGAMAQYKLDAVLDGLDVDRTIEDFGNHKIDRERIEALRIIAPEKFARLQDAIVKYGYENPKLLTVQQETALSIVFGRPVSAMMQPSNVRGFQQAFAQGADPSQGKAGEQPASKRPLGPSKNSIATAWDRQELPES